MEEIDIRILDDNNKLIFDYEACVKHIKYLQ